MIDILLDITKVKNLNSGLGQFSLQFAQHLIRSDQSDFNPIFLAPSDFNKDHPNAIIRKTGILDKWRPIASTQFKIFHALHQDSPYIPPVNSRYILTIHDLNFLEEKKSSKVEKRIKRLQSKIDRADGLTFISNFTKKKVYDNLNVHPSKLTRVIYNGVDKYEEEVQEMMKSPELPQNLLFSIGIISPKKNFHVLVEMMRCLPADYHLIIAGEKSSAYAREIMDTIQLAGLEGRINLIGPVSEAEKHLLYKHCRAFVFPSKHEGFGMPVIEAMHYGKPVFVLPLSSLPEIASNHAFYWPSEEGSEMSQVLLDGLKKFTTFDAEGNKVYASSFNWTNSINQYLKFYLEVIKFGN
jgi:glycosyltransferase involved in cell wall biosynthesis